MRLSALRHDMLHIRRTLAPTRDAVREVIDNRVEFAGDEVFTHEVELNFGNAYDKLLRAADNLELARDLLAGVRDYHQAQIANEQNDVMKRLTAIASILLLPRLIVGLYGQNFRNIPELHWGWGYYWSLGLIAITSLARSSTSGASAGSDVATLNGCRITSARTARTGRSTSTDSRACRTRRSPATGAASGSCSS